MRSTKLTEVVGGRVRQAREARGWTQAQLGEAVAEYLGEGWSRPAVSTAESGGRDFRAVELLALGLTLGRPIGWFFRPDQDSPVELPGRDVPAHIVNLLGSGPSTADPQAFEDAVEAVTRVLAEHWPALAQEVLGADPVGQLPPAEDRVELMEAPEPAPTVEAVTRRVGRERPRKKPGTTTRKGGRK